MQSGHDAVCGGACRLQNTFCEEARTVQSNLAFEACSSKVFHELSARGSGEEAGHCIGFECCNFG